MVASTKMWWKFALIHSQVIKGTVLHYKTDDFVKFRQKSIFLPQRLSFRQFFVENEILWSPGMTYDKMKCVFFTYHWKVYFSFENVAFSKTVDRISEKVSSTRKQSISTISSTMKVLLKMLLRQETFLCKPPLSDLCLRYAAGSR